MKKITPSDFYSLLWKCRDFELKHLWQRSIFLTAFIVLCFTGYGSLLLKMFEIHNYISNTFLLINFLAICVSFVGCIISILWIMMSKASKSWYEHYENAIFAFTNSEEYKDFFESGLFGLNAEDIEGYKEPNFNDSIFSTKAGAYSVSKINIALGQLLLLIWFLLLLFHSLVMVHKWEAFKKIILFLESNSYFFILLFLVLGIYLFLLCKKQLKSSFFK